jgi:hypothetical protein
MYRPDGFINPFPETITTKDKRTIPCMPHQIFNAGANAMLKALREKGKAVIGGFPVSDTRIVFPLVGKDKGTLVFIPDEKE